MESITIGQIVGAIGVISVIGGFIVTIVKSISKAWQSKVTSKFDELEDRLDKAEESILSLKDKKVKFERMAQESKEERVLLLEGLLVCLEKLKDGQQKEQVEKVSKKINTFLLEKLHN